MAMRCFRCGSSSGSNTGRGTVEYENQLDSELSNVMKEYFYNSPIDYIEPTYWCNISYYEYKVRVGESFNAIRNPIAIDGFTDPASLDRFCLGLFTNVHRDEITKRVLSHIGKGIKLFTDKNNVYIECCGKNQVFVQSYNANVRQDAPPNTVCRLPPGGIMNVFNTSDFATRLQQAVSGGYETVDNLKYMCLIQVSFVKGWGADYQRSNVLMVPCWVEIRLNGSLQWVHKVLEHMGPPNGKVTSDS